MPHIDDEQAKQLAEWKKRKGQESLKELPSQIKRDFAKRRWGNKRMWWLPIFGLLFIFCSIAPWHIAKFTIKAVDDNGKPLVGMPVDAGIYAIGEVGIRKGKTDKNGLFVVEEGIGAAAGAAFGYIKEQ